MSETDLLTLHGDHVDDMLAAMVRDPETGLPVWCEAFAKIKAKNTFLEPLHLNLMQRQMADAIGWCLANDKPIRLIVVKPRQKGCSTFSVAAMYWLMNLMVIEAVLIGAEYSQTDNLMEIFKRYGANDNFDWQHDQNIMEKSARFGNGSRLQRETANDEKAGRSGTFNFLCATEVAYWAESGVANASKVLAGIMNCVPDLAGTCVILESTANGPTGAFYDKFMGAVTLEDFKEGREGNGFIQIFAPWFAFDDSWRNLTTHEAAAVMDSYTDGERAMVSEYGLKPEQIAYYRRVLEEKCDNDLSKMQMDYPSSIAEAFHASSNQRFHSVGLQLMRSKAAQDRWQWGTLEGQDRDFVWVNTEEGNARLALLENPKEGCRYCLALDPMTGATQTDGDDPDYHAGIVLRSEYYDAFQRYHPPKEVARLHPDCQWDIDLVEEWVWRLSQYFGNCLIIPEINMDRGLTQGLSRRGANVYERQTDDDRGDVRSPKPSGKLGFNTRAGYKEGTRNWILETLAKYIREYRDGEPGIEAHPHTVQELHHFIINPKSGKAEAASGKHDDSVIALAIALHCQSQGTIYQRYIDRSAVPRDLKEDFDRIRRRTRKRSRGRYS